MSPATDCTGAGASKLYSFRGVKNACFREIAGLMDAQPKQKACKMQASVLSVFAHAYPHVEKLIVSSLSFYGFYRCGPVCSLEDS